MNDEASLRLTEQPLDLDTAAFPAGIGADVRFLGTVRGSEKGRSIAGIRYTAYASMALKLMHELRTAGLKTWGAHGLVLHHRLGFVAAEDVSIVISVRTPHSAEAFEICRWYLAEVKQRVPIWKEIVEHG
jgi:molybdopterin synthase catalytic subunit